MTKEARKIVAEVKRESGLAAEDRFVCPVCGFAAWTVESAGRVQEVLAAGSGLKYKC